MDDPYKILGVSKTAKLDEIKKAYRQIAKKWHPDLNPGNTEAEKKFKEATKAFELIGTAEAKAKFDRGESEEQLWSKAQANDFSEDIDSSDLFEKLFGRGRFRNFSQRGHDELYRMEIDLRDVVLGATRVITLPSGKSLEVKIPAGIEEGKKLKFSGLGGRGIGSGAPGDAYVEISIKPDEHFKREGMDLVTELSISFFEALMGAEVEVPTLDGSVMVKIPSGVSTGTKLRIKKKGVAFERGRGHLIIILKVVMPKEVPGALKQTVSELSKKYNYNPRSN